MSWNRIVLSIRLSLLSLYQADAAAETGKGTREILKSPTRSNTRLNWCAFVYHLGSARLMFSELGHVSDQGT
jgi:hypothetical protein